MSITIIFAVVFLISLVILTSCLGIYLSKKYEVIGNLSSKRNTIILVSILNIIIFLILFERGYNIGGAIGSALGYVLGLPFTMGYVGTFIMRRVFKKNLITKKDYWSASFFSLIWVIILTVKV
jgi:hypothetical protein